MTCEDKDKETIETLGTQSLGVFQTVVRQNEEIFGPLVGLGKKDQYNTITLCIGTSPEPDKLAVLETYASDAPPDKAGYELICSGECLVDGKPAKVAAYRPK